MAWLRRPRRPDSPDQPDRRSAELVRVEVVHDRQTRPETGPGAHPAPAPQHKPLRRLLPAVLVVALAAAAIPSLLSGSPRHPKRHPSPIVNQNQNHNQQPFGDPNDPGIDAIAAAFRGPLRCLHLTFAASDPNYAVTQPGPGAACRGSQDYKGAVFLLIGQEWRLIVAPGAHACPVPAVPQAVQAELRICPAGKAARRG